MSRHVVLMSRDTSLRFALKTLLGAEDTVTELESVKGWRSLNGTPVDAVVVDLPPSLRKTAVDALQRRFSGPLVVLLDMGEELHDEASRRRCAALHRPFGMSELWSLLTSDEFDTPDIAHGQPQAGARPQASDLTEPMPVVTADMGDNGAAPGRDVPAPVPAEPEAPGWEAPGWEVPDEEVPAATLPRPPATEVPPANAVMGGVDEVGDVGATSGPGPAADDPRPAPLTRAAIWEAVDEAPQAVATRLAQRLRVDVVALLLDNGEGVLETVGGVGLSPAERHLQVTYGHNVLRELFRVGVGLIDDTERVNRVIGGLPIGDADTLMMVPLAHEGHGFGVLLAGRYRPSVAGPNSEFTELEIEALMDFAEDIAPALRSAILLRRLKGQFNLAEGL